MQTARRIGAIHRPAPLAVPHLASVSNLAMHAPAASTDWQSKLALGDALGNDEIGNCVPCAQLRHEQLFLANAAGSTWTPTKDEAVALYEKIGDYNPADPTTAQNGTDTVRAMSTWCSQGYRVNDQLEDVPHWTKLDPTNTYSHKIAIDLFGAVALTLALPKAVMDLSEWTLTPSGDPATQPWSEGGHRVLCGRHGDGGFYLVTWGEQIFASAAFLQAYCVAADVAVSRFWLGAMGTSPAGLDWDGLTQASETLKDSPVHAE